MRTVNVLLPEDEHGVIRVGNTRVTLETVIHAFQRGETPEQIVDDFDVLNLADIYGVIAYYLQNRDEVDEYVRRAEAEAKEMRRDIEARDPDLAGLRERLQKRLEEKKQQS